MLFSFISPRYLLTRFTEPRTCTESTKTIKFYLCSAYCEHDFYEQIFRVASWERNVLPKGTSQQEFFCFFAGTLLVNLCIMSLMVGLTVLYVRTELQSVEVSEGEHINYQIFLLLYGIILSAFSCMEYYEMFISMHNHVAYHIFGVTTCTHKES